MSSGLTSTVAHFHMPLAWIAQVPYSAHWSAACTQPAIPTPSPAWISSSIQLIGQLPVHSQRSLPSPQPRKGQVFSSLVSCLYTARDPHPLPSLDKLRSSAHWSAACTQPPPPSLDKLKYSAHWSAACTQPEIPTLSPAWISSGLQLIGQLPVHNQRSSPPPSLGKLEFSFIVQLPVHRQRSPVWICSGFQFIGQLPVLYTAIDPKPG